MDAVICKEVIITTLSRRGDGNKTAMRVITEIWEKDGTKIAENDPLTEFTDYVSKEELQIAMQEFIATGSVFNDWFDRNFGK